VDRSLIFLCLQISVLQKGFWDHSQSALACLYSKCGHRVATPSRAAPYDQYQHQRTAERFCPYMDSHFTVRTRQVLFVKDIIDVESSWSSSCLVFWQSPSLSSQPPKYERLYFGIPSACNPLRGMNRQRRIKARLRIQNLSDSFDKN